VPGEEQERGVHEHLVPGEHAGLLPLREHRDEVRARPSQPRLHQRLHVFEHAPHPLGQGPEAVGLAPVDVKELVGELAQMLAVLRRDAHHLRDHPHRKRRREVGQHVHPPPRPGFVEKLRHRPPDEGPPRLHGLRREVPVHDLPHRQVLGPVVLDELVGAERPHVPHQAQIAGIDTDPFSWITPQPVALSVTPHPPKHAT